jgi:hypothetical protein
MTKPDEPYGGQFQLYPASGYYYPASRVVWFSQIYPASGYYYPASRVVGFLSDLSLM